MTYTTTACKQELKKIEDWLKNEYASVHTGKATPLVLDSVLVESYGSRSSLKNVASVTIEDSKTLRIAPWDKTQIKAIESAIAEANLGLSVVSDSDGVRAIFPMLTTENRTKLVKVLKEKLEDARISVRKVRQFAIDETTDLSIDDAKRAKDDIQKCVDEANQNLEAIFDKKEVDVMK
jgi:ribosome recycling factor